MSHDKRHFDQSLVTTATSLISSLFQCASTGVLALALASASAAEATCALVSGRLLTLGGFPSSSLASLSPLSLPQHLAKDGVRFVVQSTRLKKESE